MASPIARRLADGPIADAHRCATLERCNELGRRWGCARQRAQLCLRERRAYQAPSDAGNHLREARRTRARPHRFEGCRTHRAHAGGWLTERALLPEATSERTRDAHRADRRSALQKSGGQPCMARPEHAGKAVFTRGSGLASIARTAGVAAGLDRSGWRGWSGAPANRYSERAHPPERVRRRAVSVPAKRSPPKRTAFVVGTD